jgi:hypothetical protein
MTSLITSIEQAGEGSLALDIELMTLLGGARDVGDGVYYGPNNETWHTSDAAENEGCWMLPAPSRSLDAALALAERVLKPPYTGPITLTIAGSGVAYIDHSNPCRMGVQAFGNTPALALCLAVLRATQKTT